MHGNYAPKTNISRGYYKQIVSDIEYDPLVRHTTITAAAFIAVIAITLGGLIWFAKFNPGNLISTSGTVASISSGKTDTIGSINTFVTFNFSTREGEQKSVRQMANKGLEYHEGQAIRIGYHPKNANYARLLDDNRPPQISLYLWIVPFLLMIWFIFVALFRYNARQREIWAAAEAADVEE